MATILEEYNNSFEFHDENPFGQKEYTIVKVNVQKKQYENGDIFYYVNYDYEYSNDTREVKETNPLISLGDYGEIHNHNIIYANELSDSFIKYLMMPYEELIQFSGNNTSQHYKYNIMKAIKIFLD